jgi:hypothetical protein
MKYSIIAAIFVIIFAGSAFVWLVNKDNEGEDVSTYSLTIELAAPVKTKLKKTSDGNPVGYNPKMVSVTVTLNFEGPDKLTKAQGEIRTLRRAYSNAIGSYLSKTETTNNIELDVREIVSAASEKILGIGIVAGFDVEGKFTDVTDK